MARPLLWCLLLCPASGSRLENRASPWSPGADAAVRRAAAGLSADIARHVFRLVPRPATVTWATFSDGLDGGARVILPGTEQPEWVLSGGVEDMRLWPAGDRIVVFRDGDATIWHVWTGRFLRSLQHGAAAWILDMQVFPDGDRVATLGDDRVVVVWDAASCHPLQRLGSTMVSGPFYLRLLGDAHLVTWGSYAMAAESPATIWDLASSSRLHELRQPSRSGAISLLEASPCGSKLVTAGVDDAVYLWDTQTGRLQWELRAPGRGRGKAAVSRGGARIVAEADGELSVWDGTTGELRQHFALGSRSDLVALLPGGRHAAAINGSEAAVWDTDSGERVLALESDAGLLRQLAMGRVAASSCGRLLAACGLQHVERATPSLDHHADLVETLSLWDAHSGRMLYKTERRQARTQDGMTFDIFNFEVHGWSCHVAVATLATMADELLGASPMAA